MMDRARFLKSNGDSVRTIAAKLGVPRATVGDWVRGMNVEATYHVDCQGAGCTERFTALRPFARFCSLKCCPSRVRV